MTLFIRADASAASGFGHVMRTLAVAEYARAAALDVTYVTSAGPAEAVLRDRGFDLVVANESGVDWLAAVTSHDRVLFDGYHFEPQVMRRARSICRTAAVTDFATGSYPVDVLVCPNPVSETSYETLPDTTVRVGVQFAMVRPEFAKRRRLRDSRTPNLVVTFGGSDILDLSHTVALAAHESRLFGQVTMLVGPAYEGREASAPGLATVRNPPLVSAVFDRADVAVSAAGSTTWELLAMGIPALLVPVADNQRVVVEGLRKSDATVVVGTVREIDDGLAQLADQKRLSSRSQAALDLIDGRGAERVLDLLSA